MSEFHRRGARVLILALSLAGAADCSINISEQRLLHPTPAGPVNQEAVAHAAPAFTVSHYDIVAPDGTHLYAVRLRQPDARATILYFGGRRYTIGEAAAKTASRFAPLGLDLFIADYRGYGQSQGTPTESSVASDVLAVFDYVAALPDVGPIIVHGHSMGSFAAGYVAAHRPVAGVVLESSATTTEDWVRARTPFIVKPFVRVKISDELKGKGNRDNVEVIDEPLLILVGALDTTTPAPLSKKLYAASPLPPDRKTLVVVADAGHGGVMNRGKTITAYRRFLTTILGLKLGAY
jgi:fermentation-respiration switch protein FrsA (DUF1100 family)